MPRADFDPIEPDWPAPANVLALTTTRGGGHSGGNYRGMNLGDHVGDKPSTVAANRESMQRELPAQTNITWLSQVHGSRVVRISTGVEAREADASWTAVPGQACAVLTADCLPVLFCDRAGTAVAAAHAGWRGLLAGVLQATISAMPVESGEIMAWLGPAIGQAAFEVGPEVRSNFLQAADPQFHHQIAACFTPHPVTRTHFSADLYQLARTHLQAAGVADIFGAQWCTYSDPARFYSYRRDGQTGRMASLICLRPA